MTIERQSRIELLLCEEFSAEGYKVKKDEGNFVALIETKIGEGSIEWTKIDLTGLAEAIDRRLA